MLELDGSFGEGGGQILRTSLALALLTGCSFHLRHIRARRPKPGLKPQHVMSVRAAATVGHAQVRGDNLGSSDLVFEPGEVTSGNYHFAIGTAGATGLVLHTLYLPLALRGSGASRLVLEGGTHVTASPCFHFLKTTWQPYMAFCGLSVQLDMVRPGFYPRGGGRVEVSIQPCPRVQGVRIEERGPLKGVCGFSAVADLPQDIANRQARRAVTRLGQAGLKAALSKETWSGGPGTVLAVVLDTTPVPVLFFGLGERGKRAERVADEAVEQALAYHAATPAAVDAHSADQIVLPLALANGPSTFSVAKVTSHLTTNVAVIRRFVERDISVVGKEGGPGEVRIA